VTGPQVILIIEDNPRNLKLARDILNHVGYRTLEAENAEDGLALAKAERPHLVLMDVQLPGMNGVEALGRLRNNPLTADIPVVALTAFAMKDDRDQLLAVGFDAYLEKPLNVREFPSQVAGVLGRADMGSPS
jgi:two-component system, cell cycle response regulator DivK